MSSEMTLVTNRPKFWGRVARPAWITDPWARRNFWSPAKIGRRAARAGDSNFVRGWAKRGMSLFEQDTISLSLSHLFDQFLQCAL